MQTLSIDIETYSDVNLSKCGVYKYAESPDFEILLFGYSADGSEVTVIDLAQGERLPQEIIDALTDDAVIKWAFNANFERVCLSRYLRDLGVSLDPFHDNHPLSTECARFLNPESWRCSMVWAATMGLPLSLEGVGAVLGLEKQKLTEGKDLIKYFSVPCAPTKANGSRTRNHPFHAPDKWEAFKKYNIRDVETEIGIKDRLAKFPVPEEVWDEYHIDQEINDRGVRLDMDLVHRGIQVRDHNRHRSIKRLLAADAFAGSEEPWSVLLFFCKNFFLPASFSAFRAFHVSRPPHVHSKICLPVCRYISVVAILAFIVSGLLLNAHSDKSYRKYHYESKHDKCNSQPDWHL